MLRTLRNAWFAPASIAVVVLTTGFAVLAGNLEPPGPPAPTMKPLDEVEPRTAIRAADLPLTITAPGSYYLVEDIVAGGAGISIETDDVTIDLMGFSLVGGTGDGISSIFGTKNVSIRNGSVAGWDGDGIDIHNTDGSHVEDVRAEGNVARGIYVGENAVIVECVAANNGSSGIETGEAAAISSCSTMGNTGSGIRAMSDSSISNCATFENGVGINTFRSSISNTTANSNVGNGFQASNGTTIVGCTASNNGGDGIQINGGGVVSQSSVTFNDGDGIEVGDDALIQGNTCYRNGRNAGGRGIYAFARGNRIEGNNITFNDVGVKLDLDSNTVFRNTFNNNQTQDLDVAAGNDVGPMSTAALATSPFSNLQF